MQVDKEKREKLLQRAARQAYKPKVKTLSMSSLFLDYSVAMKVLIIDTC